MSRRPLPRRTPRACSSTTSRPTCTRTTRRRPSGVRRRCRSTATCCASCSGRKSCATCSIPTRSPRSSARSGREPRNADELHDLLRLRGDLRPGEFDEAHAAVLEAERRAFRARIGDDERLIAAEDAGRYRDALGVMPPSGLPDVFLESTDEPLRTLVLRYARGRGPFTTREANDHFGRDVEPSCRRSSATRSSCAASFVPAAPSASGATPTSCAACAARRSRRCGARSSPPSRRRSAASCRRGTASTAARRCARRSCRCRALPLPVSLWESEVLPRRVRGYQPSQLDQLCASGEVVWVGAGLDRVALYFREDAAALGAPAAAPRPEGEAHDRIREALARERRVLVRPARRDRARRPRPRCPRCGSSSGRAR